MPTFTASDLERIAHAIRAVAPLAHEKDRIGADRYSGGRDTLVRAVDGGTDARERHDGGLG